eukprot:6170118-Prymnesium_polylepis.1
MQNNTEWEVIERWYSNLFVAHTPQTAEKRKPATIDAIVSDLKKEELAFQQRAAAVKPFCRAQPAESIQEVMFGQ